MIGWWVVGGIVAFAAIEYGIFWSGQRPEATWVCPHCLRNNPVSEAKCSLCEKTRIIPGSDGAP
jgi:hypothetical protein